MHFKEEQSRKWTPSASSLTSHLSTCKIRIKLMFRVSGRIVNNIHKMLHMGHSKPDKAWVQGPAEDKLGRLKSEPEKIKTSSIRRTGTQSLVLQFLCSVQLRSFCSLTELQPLPLETTDNIVVPGLSEGRTYKNACLVWGREQGPPLFFLFLTVLLIIVFLPVLFLHRRLSVF